MMIMMMMIIVQYHLVEQDQVRMSHQEKLVHHVRQVDLDLNQLIILDHQQVLVVEEEVEVLVAEVVDQQVDQLENVNQKKNIQGNFILY
jgi:hypothetical protein